MIQITANIPVKIPLFEKIVGHTHRNRTVIRSSHVHRGSRCSGRSRHIDTHQQRIRITHLIIEIQIQTAIKELNIHPEIMRHRALPLQIVVTPRLHRGCQPERIRISRIVHVNAGRQLRIVILVARITQRITQLQIINHLTVRQEILLMHVPTDTHSPSRRERVVDTELRSPVRRQVEIEQITHMISVIRIEIITHATILTVRGTRFPRRITR